MFEATQINQEPTVDTHNKQQQERDVMQSIRERCTVCFNPGAINVDGYCSDCVSTVAADAQTIPTVSELMADPCSPFWVTELIPLLLRKDACDVAGALDLLAKVFGKRADDLLKSGQ